MGIEEGWRIIENEISKLIDILEGICDESPRYDSIYSIVYALCLKKSFPKKFPNDEFEELYKRYKGVYDEYLIDIVLPSILEKHDDVSMLQELVKRWANHKFMVTKLVRYFSIMDRHYLRLSKRPSLKDVGFGCFREIVYEKMKLKVKDAVIALVNRERQGNEIDWSLVKDVVNIFVEIGNDKLDCYVNDFETEFLTDLVYYYTGKGFNEITPAECFRMEKDKLSLYMHSSTEEKLFPKPVQPQRLRLGRPLPEFPQEDLENKRVCRVKVIRVDPLWRIR
ncbi:hypothetical protein MKX03_027077 [Papaver bracteatum]|nr:hypothetical protein MKX03_027077 [Papaver bracteatum]